MDKVDITTTDLKRAGWEYSAEGFWRNESVLDGRPHTLDEAKRTEATRRKADEAVRTR